MKTSKLFTFIAATAFAFAATTVAALAVGAVAKSAVNVRTGPGVGFNKIDTLFAGEAVNVTQCQSGWCYVEHPGPDGWVSANFLIAPGGGGSGGGSGSGAAAANALAAFMGALVGGVIAPPPAPPAPPPPPPPALPFGPDTCKAGFVWRDAIPGDTVCVTPDRRTLAANENATAGARVNPTGPYGPNTCLAGYVWREAYVGDVVCVTPARRTQVANENAQGPNNRVLTP
jgi:Bacterial SH3 domain